MNEYQHQYPDPPENPHGSARALGYAMLAVLIGIVLLLAMCSRAMAAEQIIGGSHVTHINRPVSITIVKTEAELRDLCRLNIDKSLYGCASEPNGKGRCVVYIRRDRLAWLYHELQHCAGVRHE